jgi:Ulp1 family protease
VELIMQDFMSIRDRRWVTDRVVNGYFYLLEQRANRRARTSRAVVSFTSFFYNRLVGEDKIEGDPNPGEFDFRRTERWTKKLDKVQRLCLSRWILVPVNMGRMLWALAVLDFRSKTITYYDSF